MDGGFEETLMYSGSENSDEEDVSKSINNQLLSPEKPTLEASDEEDDMNISVVKSRKTTRILSSDDDDDDKMENDDELQNMNDKNAAENQSGFIIRPSICDSDTKSSSDGNQSDRAVQVKKSVKKLKKKKVKQQHELNSSQSDSDDDTENDAKKITKMGKKKRSTSSQSSGGDSDTSSRSNGPSDKAENVKPREKLEQRMSAKMAEQQMKEIQSESQRMARQLSVNIPYHKPKQHSLTEFLSRRSIVEQQEKLSKKPIKMTNEELIEFMDVLEKRTQEAENFFQEEEEENKESNTNLDDIIMDNNENGNDNKNENSNNDVEETEPTQLEEAAQFHVDTVENNEENDINNHGITEMMGGDGEITDQNEFNAAVSEIEAFSNALDVQLETIPMNKDKVKLSIPTDHVPKLKGEKGFVIDFETNDLKPMQKTGVDELLERFKKNVQANPHANDTQDFSIFQTDTCTLERHTVHLNKDDSKSKKEARPGESLFKLRTELSKKIKEKREERIAQQLQEGMKYELQRKQMESEDEEFYDDDDDDDQITDPVELAEEDVIEEETEQNDVINEEESESSGESENDEDQTEKTEDHTLVDTGDLRKQRKRILTTIDDDSDEDTANSIVAIDDETQQMECSESNTTVANISALESEILQLSNLTDPESNKKDSSTKLFEEFNEDEEIGESQLMALCSGTFATQNELSRDVEPSQANQSKSLIAQVTEPETVQNKPQFLLSDEEETNERVGVTQRTKKKKRHTVVYSDDEEEESEAFVSREGETSNRMESDGEVSSSSEDIGERYIEYDSDENEIEVELKKSEVRKKASEFFENEAELSESEWGSDDEDENEKEMNRYEAELGDTDKFDKTKLRDELERIRLREQIDQDSKEIRILTERFIEEEDNGQERERKFRWKHLNNGENNDDQMQNVDNEATDLHNSDDENESEWRRIRYEREKLLKEQTYDKDMTAVMAAEHVQLETVADQTTVESSLNTSKRIAIIKPVSAASSKTASPFLITRSDLHTMHHSRKSFLNRDSPILEKLVCLSKTGSDNDAILNTAKGKGNYIFVATEKTDSSKRKSESSMEANNPSKKSKTDILKTEKLRPQTKAFFDSLS
ncbi:claspin isoform X2 [Contarinia nasturtii]|uniref:claspin isoform X2 n=1 Tax=Contarinia nasturtii TaxID=265458 RepID=UPI0012D499DF|nr:claspin isoform X2 [Contarinia nasturtii]